MLTFTNPSDVVMSSVQLHHPVLRPRALANVHWQWYTWLFPALLGCETPQHLPCSLLVCPLGKQNNQTCIETWTIYAHTCYIFVWTKQHIVFVWGKKRWLAKFFGGFKETVEFEEVSGPFLQEWEIKAHHHLTKPLIQANMALPYVTARWPNVAVRLQNVAAWLRSVCFLPIALLIIPSSKFLTKTLCFVIWRWQLNLWSQVCF